MKSNTKVKISTLLLILLGFQIIPAQVATGGQYTLEEATIAGGGENLTGGDFRLRSTFSLYNAGQTTSGGDYSQQGGFNNAPQLAPTAAEVSIKGRVLRADSSGLKDVTVTLIGGMMTSPMTTRTNQFGHFQFRTIEVGYYYSIQIHHRKYVFQEDSISFMLLDENEEFIFREIEKY